MVADKESSAHLGMSSTQLGMSSSHPGMSSAHTGSGPTYTTRQSFMFTSFAVAEGVVKAPVLALLFISILLECNCYRYDK
jgi:hypothetical protein